MTNREAYEMIKNLVADNEELVNFCDEKIAQLDHRAAYAASKRSAKQVANDGVKEEILMILASATEPMSTKDIRTCLGEARSPQYVTSMMGQLIKAEKVHRDYVKKVAVYSIA